MIFLRCNFKVLNPIIKFVAIFMMNNFYWKRLKLSSYKFFNYVAMFWYASSIFCAYKFITIIYISSSILSSFKSKWVSSCFKSLVMFFAESKALTNRITSIHRTSFSRLEFIRLSFHESILAHQTIGGNI